VTDVPALTTALARVEFVKIIEGGVRENTQ
jgi:hypothetical protein